MKKPWQRAWLHAWVPTACMLKLYLGEPYRSGLPKLGLLSISPWFQTFVYMFYLFRGNPASGEPGPCFYFDSSAVRMECPALCSGGGMPVIAGCLSLQRLGMDLLVTHPVSIEPETPASVPRISDIKFAKPRFIAMVN